MNWSIFRETDGTNANVKAALYTEMCKVNQQLYNNTVKQHRNSLHLILIFILRVVFSQVHPLNALNQTVWQHWLPNYVRCRKVQTGQKTNGLTSYTTNKHHISDILKRINFCRNKNACHYIYRLEPSRWDRCQEYHNCLPFGGLEETTRTSSNYVDEDYSARPEIKQSLPGWGDNCGSESSTLETDICIWRYASLVVLATQEEEEIASSEKPQSVSLQCKWYLCLKFLYSCHALSLDITHMHILTFFDHSIGLTTVWHYNKVVTNCTN